MPATIRPRTDADLPALGDALLEQQEASGYPHREPLTMPTADFLRRKGEIASWVAEVDGRPVGHIAVLAPPDPLTAPPGSDEMIRAWMRAHDRPVDRIAEVGVSFTTTHARGTGAGRALLETALAELRERDLAPCLDVIPEGAAVEIYRRDGWREVGAVRPAWLSADAPDVLAMILPVV